MKEIIIRSISTLDKLFARTYLSLFTERKSLIAILIHGLFKNRDEINYNVVHPQQSITLEKLKQFIEYFQEANYFFVSPGDIVNGLDKSKNYALITFDDGYYNNSLAYSIMNEYKVPAVFFISTNNVIQNKCYWWDVVYRERINRRVNFKKIQGEITYLKQKKHNEIEQYIIENFGEKSMAPICDIDRPFTPDELKLFSRKPLVAIGNHTRNHAILINYSPDEIESEIVVCQEDVLSITGKKPNFISYPNGNYSEEVLKISKANGLELGITGHNAKNILPINLQSNSSLLLSRYTLSGDSNLKDQCLYFRNDIQINSTLKSILRNH